MNFLKLRDQFWDYPYALLSGKHSVWGQFSSFYLSTRPFSYILTALVLSLIIGVGLLTRIQTILANDQSNFVEGIIVGTDPTGQPIGPSRLNPLQTSNPQLDKDIISLIYEPLIRLDQDGNVKPVLAENFTTVDDKSGKSYRFSLRKNIYWHDGQQLTTQDVKATFDLIKDLTDSGVSNIYGTQAAKNLELQVLDDYICEFKVAKGTLPNFYELITFNILPAHLIQQYKDAILNGQYTGIEKLTSIGTGPFILNNITPTDVTLVANKNYYLGEPKIKTFTFRLLRNEDEAITAIKSGELHGIANIDQTLLSQTAENPNMQILHSNIIYTQYWGIYFNLADSGPDVLRHKEVRNAFSYAINKNYIVNNYFTQAAVALGPIPQNSPYYAGDSSQQPQYNPAMAIQTLNTAGWVIKPFMDPATNQSINVAQKGTQQLKFTLAYVDNPDRARIVNSVISDLAKVGIAVTGKPLSPDQLINARVTQNFDLLLFGVSTFVDPDRYEFFHSSQIQSGNNIGLNISAYVSSATVPAFDPVKKKAIKIPLVDQLLDDARKSTNIQTRKDKYAQFQKAIADDVPVIFLYHPSLDYLVNKRVRNIDLSQMYNLEDRFIGIQNWEIHSD